MSLESQGVELGGVQEMVDALLSTSDGDTSRGNEVEQVSLEQPLQQLVERNTTNDQKGEEDEIADLLDQREELLDFERANESYIRSIAEAYEQTKAAKREVRKLSEYLVYVDQYRDDEQRGAYLPLRAETVRPSPFSDLIANTPLLRAHAEEIEELRMITFKVIWRNEDCARLKKVVSMHCKRFVTLKTYAERKIDDLDEFLAAISEEDLMVASLPDPETGMDKLDWTAIAEDIGTKHSAEDCRTQWLMIERSTIRSGEWQEDELAHLRAIVQRSHIDGAIRDWNAVAAQLANGRSAFDCFVASQRHDLNALHPSTKPHAWARVPFSDREAREFERLHRVWGNRAVIIEERLGTSRPKTHITSRMAAAQETSIKWSGRADNALIRFLSTASRMRRSNLMREPERIGDVDWSTKYVGRPKNAGPAALQERWHFLVQDFGRNPERYVQTAKRGGK